jgi:acetylornithine/succinyldiaminopimelate/putrescine aminotransferase
MPKSEKINVDLDLQGNTITNMVIGSNSDMSKIGAIRFNPETKNLEYNDGTKIEEIITKDTNI